MVLTNNDTSHALQIHYCGMPNKSFSIDTALRPFLNSRYANVS
jgi:hypothetical protein